MAILKKNLKEMKQFNAKKGSKKLLFMKYFNSNKGDKKAQY
ncbi:hypothetical protein C8P67_114130 [Flavobacterium aquicola]|uniref:Uncharacterized protein n=1 Tax=Flavobacterium aquicola TaxID=1682742 RepID=A0A3E0E456_9FLAO|nr:hypothetical protein C8P67_114130 [Flavobacterium aquicola]